MTVAETTKKETQTQAQVDPKVMEQELTRRLALWLEQPLKYGIERSTSEVEEALGLAGKDGSLIRKWIGYLRTAHGVSLLAEGGKHSPRNQQYIWHICFYCSKAPHHAFVAADGSLVSSDQAKPGDLQIPKLYFTPYVNKGVSGGFPELRVNNQASANSTATQPETEKEEAIANYQDGLTDRIVKAGEQAYGVIKTQVAKPVSKQLVNGLFRAVGEATLEEINDRLEKLENEGESGGLLEACGLDLTEVGNMMTAAFNPDAFIAEFVYEGKKSA
jgi:hypothetical protein